MIFFENNNSDKEDEKYAEILKHIGHNAFCQYAQTILESDFIILTEHKGNQDAFWFTYENIEDFINYIEDVVFIIRKEVINVGDKELEYEIHKKLQEIINNYWGNTIEFNYTEFYLHN